MRFFVAMLALSVFVSPLVAKDNVDVNDLVKQHLNSIGSDQSRAAAKTRIAEGTLRFRILSGSGSKEGKQVFISENNKLVCLLKLPDPNYHGERFVSDGKRTMVGNLRPGIYSNFGEFVRMHDEILTEGLWGGTLSTGWALVHLDERHAKLQYRGLKKVDGREMHLVRYTSSKRSDLEIELYFEADTLRHVMTVYSLTINPQIARTEAENARQQATHYRLEERFSDFKNTDNLMLPGGWTIQFTSDVPESATGVGNTSITAPLNSPTPLTPGDAVGRPGLGASRSSVNQFEVTETNISHNQTLDPRNFEIK
ncbi:MAG: hypothetical protein HY233_03260 [Acidobacteriales bacterium]|nr:hypothetical protein [Terriglobales bacterium]